MNRKDISLGGATSDLQLFILLGHISLCHWSQNRIWYVILEILFVMPSSPSVLFSILAETDKAHLYKPDNITKSKCKVRG